MSGSANDEGHFQAGARAEDAGKSPTRGVVAKRLAATGPSFVRHPSLAGVEIRVVRDRGAHSAPTPPMITSDLRLAMVLRGANRFLYRGSSWIVPGGTLILAEPGELHAVESVDGAFDVLILFVDLETVSGLRRSDASAFKDGVSFRGPLTRDGTCVCAFRSLASTLADTSAASLLVEERMLSVVEAVSSAYAGRIPPADRTVDASAVRRARWIDAGNETDPDQGQVPDEAGQKWASRGRDQGDRPRVRFARVMHRARYKPMLAFPPSRLVDKDCPCRS